MFLKFYSKEHQGSKEVYSEGQVLSGQGLRVLKPVSTRPAPPLPVYKNNNLSKILNGRQDCTILER